MPVAQNEASIYLASHHGVLGKGYKEVESLDTLDPDEYELEVGLSLQPHLSHSLHFDNWDLELEIWDSKWG
jgi:hypothetical protein